MARWAAFAGLTGVLLASLLALAHLSHRAISDGAAVTDRFDHRHGAVSRVSEHPRAPVVPRFERQRDVSTTRPADSSEVHELSTGALLLNVALTQGLFGVVLAASAWYFRIPADALGLGGTALATGLRGVLVGLGLGVVLWAANEAVGALVEAAGFGYDETLRGLLAPSSYGGWVLLLGGVLPVVAVVEEFVFRAAAIGAVAAGFDALSPWVLAVVSSLAFGLAHGAQGRTGIVVTGALGFALAVAFILTQSLLVVVVAHYVVNAFELVVHEGLGFDRPGYVAPD